MAAQLQIIASSSVKVRWKETYASEGLNRKLAGVIAPGIYRGFGLSTNASPLFVTVTPDPETGEHVAVIETETGFSLTVRDDASGAIGLDLSPLAPASGTETVIVCVVADYVIGADTSSEFRGYLLSEYDGLTQAERDSLAVLGTVLLPSTGLIPAVNITPDRKTSAWQGRPAGDVPWNPLLKNGGFEMGETSSTTSGAARGWTSAAAGAGDWRLTEVESASGLKSIELNATAATTFTFASVTQNVSVPVSPGQQIQVRVTKKAIQAATGGTGALRLVFDDAGGSPLSDINLGFDLGSVDASFVAVESTVSVPAGAAFISSAGISMSNVTYLGAGVAIRIDEVQAWLEASPLDWLPIIDSTTEVFAKRVLVEDPSGDFSDPAGVIAFSKDAGEAGALSIARADNDLSEMPPALSLHQSGSYDYTLLWESVAPGGYGYRRYGTSAGITVETVNARYSNATGLWSKDVNADRATRIDMGESFTIRSYREGGTVSWLDAAWENGGGTDRFGQEDRSRWRQNTFVWTRDPGDTGQSWTEYNTQIVSAENLFIRTTTEFSSPGMVQCFPGGGDPSRWASYDQIWYHRDDSIMIYELPVYCINTDSLRFRMGWASTTTFSSSPDYVFLRFDPNISANWLINIGTAAPYSGSPNSDTVVGTVTPTWPGEFLLRLEIIGANHPEGFAVKGYVNGEFIGQSVDATSMSQRGMRFGLFANNDGALVADGVFCGSPTLTWSTVR